LDQAGTMVVHRKLRRADFLRFFEAFGPCLIGMEAHVTAHYWARSITILEYGAKRMPPTYVKPFGKRQINNAADAEVT